MGSLFLWSLTHFEILYISTNKMNHLFAIFESFLRCAATTRGLIYWFAIITIEFDWRVILERQQMKQKLLALTALSLLGSAAYAQSSVMLYGLIDEGYLGSKRVEDETKPANGRLVKKSEISRANGLSANNIAASRIGVKATEDLGGGAKAGAVIEFGFDPNASSANITSRQAFVHLGGKETGTVSVGRIHTKTFDYLVSADQSGSTVLPGSILYNRGLESSKDLFDRGNMASYSFGNDLYTLTASYGNSYQTSQSSSSNSNNGSQAWGLAADGKYGNWFGGAALLKTNITSLGYQGSNNLNYVGGIPPRGADNQYRVNVPVSTTYTPVSSETAAQAITAFSGYDFGLLKATYTYHQQAFKTASSNASAANWTQRYHQLGTQIPISSKITGIANYVIGFDNGDTGHHNSGITRGFQVGAKYAFTKRTDIYAAYGQQASNRSLTAGGSEKEREQAYTVGLRHMF